MKLFVLIPLICSAPHMLVACSSSDSGANPDSNLDAGSGADADIDIDYTQVTIDFSEVSGTALGNQYAQWGSFTSDPPNEVVVLGPTFANSVSDWVCPSLGNDCSNDLFVDFTAPVTNVGFIVTLAHGDARVVTARLLNGDTVIVEQDIQGTGSYVDVIEVELSNSQPATRLELVDIDDYYGIGYDDLHFGFPE